MRGIQQIYQDWLDGNLSQEDALFAIGDLLEEETGGRSSAQLAESGEPITLWESA